MQTLTMEQLDLNAGGRGAATYTDTLGGVGFGLGVVSVVKYASRGASWGRMAGPWGMAAGAILGGAFGLYAGLKTN